MVKFWHKYIHVLIWLHLSNPKIWQKNAAAMIQRCKGCFVLTAPRAALCQTGFVKNHWLMMCVCFFIFYSRPLACHWAWAVGTALAQTVENKALSQPPLPPLNTQISNRRQKIREQAAEKRRKTSRSHNGKTTLADVCQEELGGKTHKLAQVTGMMLVHSEDDCLSSPWSRADNQELKKRRVWRQPSPASCKNHESWS